MRAAGVSSFAIAQSMRNTMLRNQGELVKAQKEMSTLKRADMGLALGARTAQAVSLERDLDRLNGIVDSNALVSSRLASTQKSLDVVADAANTFLSALTGSVSGDSSGSVMQASARAALDTLTATLNQSVNGEHLFAGTNTDVKPVDGFTAGSAGKTAFDAAFQSYFGFAKDDPAAAAVTAADMDGFLTSAVEPQFLGAGWQANWSTATDDPIVSRISLNETSPASVSANATGLRRLAMAAATISDLIGSNLSAAGKKQALERAVASVGQAVAEIADLQSGTGVIQKRVADASTRIEAQTALFEQHLTKLEGVDPTEAATRVSDLLNQIETSYALTSRIQQLSLLKYLS